MGLTIGIDFGDTNFSIAVVRGQNVEIVKDQFGKSTFPSKVALVYPGLTLVGNEIGCRGLPEHTVINPVLLLGIGRGDVANYASYYNFDIYWENGELTIETPHVVFTASQVATEIFAYVKRIAEEYTGEKVDNIVVAIPDGASPSHRSAIKGAAELAGLHVLNLIGQSIAAVLGYRFDQGRYQKIAVCDFGANHTSVAIIEAGENRLDLTTTNSKSFGTQRLIRKMMLWSNQTYYGRNNIDLFQSSRDYPFLLEEIRIGSEDALIELSSLNSTEFLIGGQFGLPEELMEMDRNLFEQVVRQELQSISNLLDSASRYRIDGVLLTGGGCRIPVLKRMVDQLFKVAPFTSNNIDADLVIAYGAAIKGGIILGDIRTTISDRVPYDLGTYYVPRFIRDENGEYDFIPSRNRMYVLISKGTSMPVQKSIEFSVGSVYDEKVLAYLGYDNGQDRPENHPDMRTLAEEKNIHTNGDKVRNTFIVDHNGIPRFVVTKLGTGETIDLTGFSIEADQ